MIRLALRVRRAQAEHVLAELLELAPAGVEEVDRGDVVEYAVYGASGELPALPALRAAAGGALVEVESREIGDDWSERWREFHRPVLVSERLWVRPPWEPPLPRSEAIDVVIDPGRAFGTGGHPTTRLCLELLLDLGAEGRAAEGPAAGWPEPPPGLVDLGCGSGVLAIAAAKLGFSPVLAVDHERAALDATRANARANGVEVETRRVDLRRQAPPRDAIVVANLSRPLLRELASRLPDPLPRHVIVSGVLPPEAGEVADEFAARGLAERARRGEGEWTALLLSAAPARAGLPRRRSPG